MKNYLNPKRDSDSRTGNSFIHGTSHSAWSDHKNKSESAGVEENKKQHSPKNICRRFFSKKIDYYCRPMGWKDDAGLVKQITHHKTNDRMDDPKQTVIISIRKISLLDDHR